MLSGSFGIKMAETSLEIELVERRRFLVLLFSTLVIAFLLVVWSPSVSNWALFMGYGLCFASARLFAGVHRRQEKSPESLPCWPMVSVLIPAHNEETVIFKTVQLALNLDYPNYEVLAIDDRSTDGTLKALRNLQTENIGKRFQIVCRSEKARPGKAAVLNDALPHCQGEVLCVLDADAWVGPDFLKALVPYFSVSDVGAVQARKELLNPYQNGLIRCQQYEYALDAHLQSCRDAVHGCVELRGNGMLLRRQVLESLGGWNERSLTEDLDFCTRMHAAGWDIRYAATVSVKEEGVPNLLPLVRQRLRWTEGSIIRYLEYADSLLSKRRVAFYAKLDMLQFVFEFLAPFWLLLENVMRLFKSAGSQLPETPVLFSPPAFWVLTAYFLWAAYQGISRFHQGTFWQLLRGTLMVYVYLSFLWLPIVFWLTGRILFRRERNLKWEKTQHYGMAVE